MNVLNKKSARRGLAQLLIILCCSSMFGLLTVYVQQQHLTIRYLEEGYQIKRHIAVLQGTSGNAWQYRVLSEYLVEGFVLTFKRLHVPHPVASAFLSFRFLQNTLIFFLAALYYKKLGLNTYSALIGLSLLAWGMSYAVYHSDLSFSTYSNIIFYLVAGLIILSNKDEWIIPVTALAALNMETSGFIPCMLLASRVSFKPRIYIPKRAVLITAISVALYVIVFVGLRYVYGTNRPLTGPVGIELIRINFFNFKAWLQLFATLSILPIMAVLAFRWWPPTLRAISLAVVPLWLMIIPFTGGIIETRHYLVPLALVFVPGALLGALHCREDAGALQSRAA
jgi:hypothetical protein